MLNQTILVGRVAKDPEIKEVGNKKVANIVLAVSRSYKNANGEYDTDFINCSLWNKTAEAFNDYCKKGDVVGIKGSIQTRSIENEKGKHTELEIVADRVTFLNGSKSKDDLDETNDLDQKEM